MLRMRNEPERRGDRRDVRGFVARKYEKKDFVVVWKVRVSGWWGLSQEGLFVTMVWLFLFRACLHVPKP